MYVFKNNDEKRERLSVQRKKNSAKSDPAQILFEIYPLVVITNMC